MGVQVTAVPAQTPAPLQESAWEHALPSSQDELGYTHAPVPLQAVAPQTPPVTQAPAQQEPPRHRPEVHAALPEQLSPAPPTEKE